MNDQSTQTVKLSDGTEVDLKNSLTWGEQQRIESSLAESASMDFSGGQAGNVQFKGDALLESKYRLLEALILKVRKGEDKKDFTRQWAENLSVSDGNLLYSKVEEVTKKNK